MKTIVLTRTHQVGGLVFFAGRVTVEDHIFAEIMVQRAAFVERVERVHPKREKLGPITSGWLVAKVGERVHIDDLFSELPAIKFYQPDKSGPSFCDTPLSTFRCFPDELPWYMRIE